MHKKILFCHVGGFGDIIQSTVILKFFKEKDSNCNITYLTTTPYQQIMKGIRLADRVEYVSCINRNDAFHGTGKQKIEDYIQKHKDEYSEIYFPQAAFHRDILIDKNNWKVIKTMFELCNIKHYPVIPFDIVPSNDNIAEGRKWMNENLGTIPYSIMGKKLVFVEMESHSGQSFINDQRKMMDILKKVSQKLKHRNDLKFILIGKEIVLTDVPDDRFYVCTLPLLSLMEILSCCKVMITPHSGLVNLYACKYCFNPKVPVIAIMYQQQSGLSIGPEGYPLIEKMYYIFDSDKNNVVDELVKFL